MLITIPTTISICWTRAFPAATSAVTKARFYILRTGPSRLTICFEIKSHYLKFSVFVRHVTVMGSIKNSVVHFFLEVSDLSYFAMLPHSIHCFSCHPYTFYLLADPIKSNNSRIGRKEKFFLTSNFVHRMFINLSLSHLWEFVTPKLWSLVAHAKTAWHVALNNEEVRINYIKYLKHSRAKYR